MGVSKSFFSILIFGRKFITFVSLNFRKCWSFPSKMNQRGVFRVFFNIPRRNQYIAYWRLRSKLDIVLAGGARNIIYFQYYRDILVLITSLSARASGMFTPSLIRSGKLGKESTSAFKAFFAGTQPAQAAAAGAAGSSSSSTEKDGISDPPK